MGQRENKVEQYLDEQVKLHLNGITRKWVSPGHVGVPDRIAFINNTTWFVEVKTVDGYQTPRQQREAKELIRYGARCAIVYGYGGVDSFIEYLKTHDHKVAIQVAFK